MQRSAGLPRMRQVPGTGGWAVSSLWQGQGTKVEAERLVEKLLQESKRVLMAWAGAWVGAAVGGKRSVRSEWVWPR